MQTYLLFLCTLFDDQEDIEYFCSEVLGQEESIDSLKFIIDNTKNVVVIFESVLEIVDLRKDLESLLNDESIIYYFLFQKKDILLSHIPETMKGLIYKPSSEILKIELSSTLSEDDKNLILNTILEKIEKHGMDSLTEDEKKFLDNFEN